MRAPRLTIQDSAYLLRQLRHFRSEVRGGVTDFYGWQMNGRARALPDDRALRDVLAYIDTLPDTHSKDNIKGNKKNGERLYQTKCSSCHGNKAEGNEKLNAPLLAGLDSWYQLEQMRKFKSGKRGSHSDDIPGQQMQAVVKMLNDDQLFIDIIDFIATIK
jgi:cytochrome c oxidase subunit II